MPTKTPRAKKRKRPAAAYIGDNIKAAREAKQLSQLELAHRCGYTGDDAGAQISRIEKGHQQPRFTTLLKLAQKLGVSVESLVTEKKKTANDY